jgi:hypothetical protein
VERVGQLHLAKALLVARVLAVVAMALVAAVHRLLVSGRMLELTHAKAAMALLLLSRALRLHALAAAAAVV